MLLTDPRFVSRLEALYLLARRVLGGNLAADRKSYKKGSGINFADYAEYQFGDDYRNVDWNIYARLESLVIKLFELEEDVNIYILFDTSHSMFHKFDYAKSLVAALAYIALSNHDRLTIYTLDDQLNTLIEPSHGRGHIFPMLGKLESLKTSGKDTLFNESMRVFQKRHKSPGVCVIVSDFFFPKGFKEGLRYLKYSKHDVFCLQTLDTNELICNERGDIELECVESKKRRKVTIGPVEKKRYEKAIFEWNDALKKECHRRELGYAQSMNDIPFDEVIQKILRQGGLIT